MERNAISKIVTLKGKAWGREMVIKGEGEGAGKGKKKDKEASDGEDAGSKKVARKDKQTCVGKPSKVAKRVSYSNEKTRSQFLARATGESSVPSKYKARNTAWQNRKPLVRNGARRSARS